MKLKIDGNLLSLTIRTLQKVVAVQLIAFKVTKNFLKVTGVGNGNAFSMTVPCQVLEKSKHSSFAIGAANFLDAVNKRPDLTLTVSESAVKVVANRYEAELLVQPYEEVVVVPDDVKQDKGLKLKDKFLNSVRENLPKLELKPLLAMYDYIPFGIRSTDEGTFMSCFDHFQSAFFFDKELTGKLDFTLPSNVFSLLAKELKGQDYVLQITDTTVYAYNDNFELAIARPQTEGQQITLDNMLDLYKSLKSAKGAKRLKFKKEGVLDLIDNAKAVYEKDSVFTVETKGDKCTLTLKSSYGKVTSRVMLDEAPDKDLTFSCDFNFFSTLLAKAPSVVDLKVTDKLLMFQNKPVTYLLSLV